VVVRDHRSLYRVRILARARPPDAPWVCQPEVAPPRPGCCRSRCSAADRPPAAPSGGHRLLRRRRATTVIDPATGMPGRMW